MAQIRVWQVRDVASADNLKALLKNNTGNSNLDIITDDSVFRITVVNDDKNTPGSIDRVVSTFDPVVVTPGP